MYYISIGMRRQNICYRFCLFVHYFLPSDPSERYYQYQRADSDAEYCYLGVKHNMVIPIKQECQL